MWPRPIRWATVAAWMAIIFYFSSIPDLHSGLQPFWDFVLRKIAHGVEYGILACLVASAVRPANRVTTRAVLIGIVVASLYAMTDEYHQTFVLGRHGAPLDWLIDTCGAVAISGLWWLSFVRRKK